MNAAPVCVAARVRYETANRKDAQFDYLDTLPSSRLDPPPYDSVNTEETTWHSQAQKVPVMRTEKHSRHQLLLLDLNLLHVLHSRVRKSLFRRIQACNDERNSQIIRQPHVLFICTRGNRSWHGRQGGGSGDNHVIHDKGSV